MTIQPDYVKEELLHELSESFRMHNQLPPDLFTRYRIKRGLRNADGTGVLVGASHLGNVHGYILNEGEREPIEGRLTYRGYNVYDLIHGLEQENRFGFEEIGYLLMCGKLPSRRQLAEFQHTIGLERALPDNFTEDMIMRAPSRDIMNKLASATLALYSYDANPDETTVENIMRQGISLMAKFPVIISHAYQAKRRYFDNDSMFLHVPDPNRSTAENILHLIRPTGEFNDDEAKLLDEPLGALDLKLRKDMQIELKRIQQRTGITFIYVTHDQEEALTMSDRVVVMNHGVIQQVGSPTDIYNEPVNAFVADFIGESNIIDGVMLEDCKVEFCGRTFECVDKGFEKNAPVDVVIRPEDLKIVYAGDGLLQGVVESIVFKGVHYEMMVRTQFFTFMVHSTMAEAVGKTVGLSVIPFDIHIMHKSAEAQA